MILTTSSRSTTTKSLIFGLSRCNGSLGRTFARVKQWCAQKADLRIQSRWSRTHARVSVFVLCVSRTTPDLSWLQPSQPLCSVSHTALPLGNLINNGLTVSVLYFSYAPERIEYPTKRYVNESRRLYDVLEARLQGRQWIVGDKYSLADIKAFVSLCASGPTN